ncbi:MAG TPA: hypothetical protein VM389_13125 [Phycisphaerae bacterium]|nr:hypothetical protein [Phycisphaerae bacterium]
MIYVAMKNDWGDFAEIEGVFVGPDVDECDLVEEYECWAELSINREHRKYRGKVTKRTYPRLTFEGWLREHRRITRVPYREINSNGQL